mmetsp:Transcript_22412/g.40403  ORF Transcript_22412/g.40403 Transcript_22412/m.40403 type:complete len:113 (-) Transcript_22412:2754-3092(-)
MTLTAITMCKLIDRAGLAKPHAAVMLALNVLEVRSFAVRVDKRTSAAVQFVVRIGAEGLQVEAVQAHSYDSMLDLRQNLLELRAKVCTEMPDEGLLDLKWPEALVAVVEVCS